jgi:dimethylargininase
MYTRALLRKPGRNYADGITTSGFGKPDLIKVLEQHEAYCNALSECGLELKVLEADERFPDGCFVEDTAVILDEAVIITRPGADTRRGEEAEISAFFSKFRKTEHIRFPGTVDGGDIMRMDNHFYIGRSKRTNWEGALQLAAFLSEYGYTSSGISVETVPHLKSGVTYIGNGNFLSIDEFSMMFPESNVITVSKEEAYSSNCLLVNDTLLISKGFPGSKRRIPDLGYTVRELDMSEFMKMDGALTCLSLLY